MMAKEPGRRFETPGQVAQALTPFFKKGSVVRTGASPEISQAGRPDAKQATPGAVSVPRAAGPGEDAGTRSELANRPRLANRLQSRRA